MAESSGNSGADVRAESADQTRALGARVAKSLEGGENLLLFGDLGAGKTTFVQGLAAGLGIKDPVKSPTYTYVREYRVPLRSTRFAHFDLHRLPGTPGTGDLESIGLVHRLTDTDSIVAVEWAERLDHLDVPDAVRIRFTDTGDGRRITLPDTLQKQVQS